MTQHPAESTKEAYEYYTLTEENERNIEEEQNQG